MDTGCHQSNNLRTFNGSWLAEELASSLLRAPSVKEYLEPSLDNDEGLGAAKGLADYR